LVSHQDGFGNDRTQPTGSSKPDDDDDGVKKKSENVAHAQDGIRPKKLKNSGACGIRHPQESARKRLGIPMFMGTVM
jgi:hypothetical protein